MSSIKSSNFVQPAGYHKHRTVRLRGSITLKPSRLRSRHTTLYHNRTFVHLPPLAPCSTILSMAVPTLLPCDGCGQLASAEHIARRLQRLEWATRFRPIHIHALLLAASAPESDSEFLYSPESPFTGLAGDLLSALSISTAGKSNEEVQADFQKRGLFLVYLLECPVPPGTRPAEVIDLLDRHLPQALARIRRSLKPKRALVLSKDLQPFLSQLSESALGCPVVYTALAASASAVPPSPDEIAAFRAALPALAAQGT